ncbi:MAG: phosphatidylglycerol lysyltransferase domain-containing protein [Candidatus Bathyarchaeia archaeon]
MPIGDLPEYPEARELSLRDKEALTELFTRLQPQISEYTFTNLYAWKSSNRCLLSSIEGEPLILREYDGVRHLMPPITTGIVEALKEMGRMGEIPPIYGLLKDEVEALAGMGFKVKSDRDNWDYVYSVEDLIELRGSKFRVKRQNIYKCLSEHSCEYAQIDRSNITECWEFYERWCRIRDCHKDLELKNEGEAIREILDNYDALPLRGAVIYVDGSLEAFTIGEQLNRDTAVIHIEKANSNIKGLYQLINNWFCRNHLAEFKWVNREQDLGIPGLRRAKMDYNPHHFIEKYVAHPPS